jgi:hypothetical protein
MSLFMNVFSTLQKGVSLLEASSKLAELVRKVEETGKPGTLTIKLTVGPNKGTIFVTDEITVKEPKGTRQASLFFPDEEGHLHRRDPNQSEMPFAVARDRAQGE